MPSNPVFTDPNDAILKDRLSRISADLRGLKLSTVEDYQAEVYSAVNAVLDLGIAMTPFNPIAGEGPAVVGDVAANFTILNNDAADIANELLRIEDGAGSLFNLAATAQNQLRQQIREFVYASNSKRYVEEFINSTNIPSSTATIDFNAGLAVNTLLDETPILPTFSVSTNSIGSVQVGSSMDYIDDGKVDTAFTWDGTVLELILTFPTPQIINRLSISLDTYQGVEIATMVTSPDGTLIEDVLQDLGITSLEVDGTSNKFSGDVIIDFPPRHAAVMRIVMIDQIGAGSIGIRNLSVSQRRYGATGQLTTNPITSPTGNVNFSVTQNVFAPYVTITHQISYDGVSFSVINPGLIQLLSSPFWYRAVLERSSTRFDLAQGPLAQNTLDPTQSPNYSIISTVTTPLGNGVLERSIQLDDISGPIVLRESLLNNTLQVKEGSIILSELAGDYAFNVDQRSISFPTPMGALIISYQTTALGSQAIADRKEFYTPLLYGFKFEA